MVHHGNALRHSAQRKREVDALRLANGEGNPGAALFVESIGVHGDGVGADWDGGGCVSSIGAGLQMALVARLVVMDQDGCTGDERARGVGNRAGDGAADHLRPGAHWQDKDESQQACDEEGDRRQTSGRHAIHSVLLVICVGAQIRRVFD